MPCRVGRGVRRNFTNFRRKLSSVEEGVRRNLTNFRKKGPVSIKERAAMSSIFFRNCPFFKKGVWGAGRVRTHQFSLEIFNFQIKSAPQFH